MQYVCGQMSRAAQKRNPGRGSKRLRRALGGTRILLAAAPTAPPCFCRWQRSSLLHRGFFTRRTSRRVLRVALAAFSAAPWQGFEKAERCPSLVSLFPPQAAVGSAAVRIHPCIPFCKTDKTETPVPGSDTGVLGGRGWIARAAHLKKPRRGFFTRRTIRRVDAVRIHPCSPFSRQIKQKLQYPVRILESLVGACGLREPRC